MKQSDNPKYVTAGAVEDHMLLDRKAPDPTAEFISSAPHLGIHRQVAHRTVEACRVFGLLVRSPGAKRVSQNAAQVAFRASSVTV
jgi:hypothetical protein